MDRSQDPLVIFTPSGKRGRFPAGTPVLAAARRLGVDLDSVCGGRGICSRCQITPAFGAFPKHGVAVAVDALSPWNAVEERYRSKRGLIEGRRLGCQACVQSDAVIDVPPESQVHRQVVRSVPRPARSPWTPRSASTSWRWPSPTCTTPPATSERLRRALAEQWGLHDPSPSTSPRSKPSSTRCARAAGASPAPSTAARTAPPRSSTSGPASTKGGLYGLAIDLGSTTIAGHLCDLATGEVLASCGLMNPQIRFGEDLMSRVSYAMMNPGGAAEMTAAVRAALNELIARPPRRRASRAS
jgi:uncharacterized 2Fe-2S/4Fe-4S cluster protein (DUF4445 family)